MIIIQVSAKKYFATNVILKTIVILQFIEHSSIEFCLDVSLLSLDVKHFLL